MEFLDTKQAKIAVLGASGLIGKNLVAMLQKHGFAKVLTPTRTELDLVSQSQVQQWFEAAKPTYVFFCAGRVGGIEANRTNPAEFIFENTMMAFNVISSAQRFKSKKLLYLGSSCCYPNDPSREVLAEDDLLQGPLEPTSEPYAIAKIAGMKACHAFHRQYGSRFITCIPANVFGPHDHFASADSHVIPALLTRFHRAKLEKQPSVSIWGSGTPIREFLYVEDLCEALIFLMDRYEENRPINIGAGDFTSIGQLAITIGQVVGYTGEIVFDSSKPDGQKRKVLESSRLRQLGWKANTPLIEGLRRSYQFALDTELI